MKKTLFLLAILALSSCKKTNDDPEPQGVKMSSVLIGFQTNTEVTVHIKARKSFSTLGQKSTNSSDSCYIDKLVLSPGHGYVYQFKSSDTVMISSPIGITLTIQQQTGNPYNFTYSSAFNYQFVVQ